MRPNPSPLSLVLFSLLTQYGYTALIWGSQNGHDNVVEKLLATGADPNYQDIVRNLFTRVMLIHVANAYVPNKVHVGSGKCSYTYLDAVCCCCFLTGRR